MKLFRKEKTHNPPLLWSIAGSDSSSGAGIQTDLQTAASLGVHCCTILTSATAQNSSGVLETGFLSTELLTAQISALEEEFPPQAVKLGVLGSARSISIISKTLDRLNVPVVLDPILKSTSGVDFIDDPRLEQIKAELFPRTTILTPNLPETEMFVGKEVRSLEEIERAAEAILKLGVKAVFIKGGHSEGNDCQDFYRDSQKQFWVVSPRQNRTARGTGCALSSALGAALAYGYEAQDSVIIAKAVLNQSLRLSREVGKSSRPMTVLGHAPWPVNPQDLPHIRSSPRTLEFPSCGSTPLGFYPIVDRLSWLERLLPLGSAPPSSASRIFKASSWRRKSKPQFNLPENFSADSSSMTIGNSPFRMGLMAFTSGRKDLESADLAALAQAGLRLGISTHSFFEVARAHAFKPSYLAIGPLFETTCKAMRFGPQGVDALQRWRKILDYPLVAIGGISRESPIHQRGWRRWDRSGFGRYSESGSGVQSDRMA